MFRSYKEFNGYSTAFRQWRADSHCKYVHGYALRFKVWFEGDLDERNWVVDFGCFKRNGVKDWFKNQFDHTTCIAKDDPSLSRFIALQESGDLDLRIMENGVGIERTAEWCYNAANKFLNDSTGGRCRCVKVEVWEHEGNSATYQN